MTLSRFFFLGASVAVSLATLLLVLRDVPLASIAKSIQAARLDYLLLAFFWLALSLYLRGLRWRELLNRRLPALRATHMVNVMFLGNQLPFRLGEVARGLLARRDGLPFATAASIVVGRLIDSVFVVLLLAAAISQLPALPREIAEGAAAFGGLALLAFLTLLALARAPQFAAGRLEKLLAQWPPLRRLPLAAILSNILLGLQPLTEPRRLAWTMLWTISAWVASMLNYYFLHLALGIETNFLLSLPLGLGLAALSIALPVSIAALGPFEAAIVLAGSLLGMGELEAISLALLLHGVTVLSYLLWGSLSMLALGLSPAALKEDKGLPLSRA